jgi:predicted TIM-barrel fold metal-dependent hydrolase
MIIDAHTHIEGLPGCPWQDPPELILRLMDEADIDRAVVMTYVDAPGDFGEYDPIQYVADAVAKWPDRLIGFARMDPGQGEAARLLFVRAIEELGFSGLKLHPFGYRQPPDSEQTLTLVREAARLGVPTLFHCGDEEYTTPHMIGRCAAAVPEATIIMGHMGGYFHVDEAMRVAERYENLILETSASPYPDRIKMAVDRVGPERVIFASDGPGCDPRLEVEKIRLAGLTPDQERQVLGESFLKVLGERP